ERIGWWGTEGTNSDVRGALVEERTELAVTVTHQEVELCYRVVRVRVQAHLPDQLSGEAGEQKGILIARSRGVDYQSLRPLRSTLDRRLQSDDRVEELVVAGVGQPHLYL